LKRVTHRSAVDAGNPHTGVLRIAAWGLTKLKGIFFKIYPGARYAAVNRIADGSVPR
jgi:hypothetical protein